MEVTSSTVHLAGRQEEVSRTINLSPPGWNRIRVSCSYRWEITDSCVSHKLCGMPSIFDIFKTATSEKDWGKAQSKYLCLSESVIASLSRDWIGGVCVYGEWACVNNMCTVCSLGGSSPKTVDPKKDPLWPKGRCVGVKESSRSLPCRPVQKKERVSAWLRQKGQSCSAVGAKEGLGPELKMDLRESQVSTFCG